MPACSNQRKRVRPARPASGLPPCASTWPGACPTSITRGATASETIGTTPAPRWSQRLHAVSSALSASSFLAVEGIPPSLPALRPMGRGSDGTMPTGQERGGLIARHLRLEDVEASPADELVGGFPDACGDSGQTGSAERGGFDAVRPLDRDAEDVGLE